MREFLELYTPKDHVGRIQSGTRTFKGKLYCNLNDNEKEHHNIFQTKGNYFENDQSFTSFLQSCE